MEYRSASHEDMPRKFLDIRFSDHPNIAEKGQLRPFPAFRRGWVKGRVPCRYLGQRPKPSESYASFISTVLKVHLSLIFLFSFFHNSVDTTFLIALSLYTILVKKSTSNCPLHFPIKRNLFINFSLISHLLFENHVKI